jgi:hypothetical protein
MSDPKFTVQRTVYRLEFDDEAHAGMVVRVRRMTLGEALHVSVALGWEDDDTWAVKVAKQRELHELFVDHLVEWNLTEEDDRPVPTTLDGLHSLEGDLVGLMVGAWQAGRTPGAVPAPLDETSTDGGSEGSTLTEIPSESLAS